MVPMINKSQHVANKILAYVSSLSCLSSPTSLKLVRQYQWDSPEEDLQDEEERTVKKKHKNYIIE